MTRFLYCFGYETPQQWVLNRQHGWDDEDSAAVIIHAESADAAYAWGREIAEASVRRLFERAAVADIPSWKAANFADAVEDAVGDIDAPVVTVGEMPPTDWLQQS